MNDKPTYKDYLLYTNKYVVKSRNQYYAITNKKLSGFDWLIISLLIAAGIVLIWLSATNNIWLGWAGDFWLLYIPLYYFLSRKRYCRAGFTLLQEGTEDWEKASKQVFSAVGMVFMIVAFVFNFILTFPSSYTVSYIHRLIDGGGTDIEMRVSGSDTLYSDEQTASERVTVPLSPYGDQVWVDITVTHTPDTARLSLDGQPLPGKDQPRKMITYAFNIGEYFKQETRFPISVADIRDGSVLTLSCGDLTREWVFDVADEEAS